MTRFIPGISERASSPWFWVREARTIFKERSGIFNWSTQHYIIFLF
jgi:hypothetical protein